MAEAVTFWGTLLKGHLKMAKTPTLEVSTRLEVPKQVRGTAGQKSSSDNHSSRAHC